MKGSFATKCMRRDAYARIDPMHVLDATYGRLAPTTSCCCGCCRCTPLAGIRCALRVFIFEAIWHIGISVARPLWEWTSTVMTIFAFVLQDATRLMLLVLSVLAWRNLSRGANGAFHLRVFLRGLFVLALLECVELALKSTEVHAVCNAPIVLNKRLERAQRANLSNFDPLSAEHWCEVVSDVYDFGWAIIALLILAYVMRVTHSYLRGLANDALREVANKPPPAEAVQAVVVELETA